MTPRPIDAVGVVGLGRMGFPIAQRLARTGYAVFVFDPRLETRNPALGAGLVVVTSIAELVRRATAVLVSVPGPEAVSDVFLGPDGLLAAGGGQLVAADLSTSTPALARRLTALGGERGIQVLDAPVSGGPTRAADGTLAVMAGGTNDALRTIAPVLRMLGDVVHVGGPGCGQATKLCNNLLTGVHMTALAESVALAQREGLDPARLFAVISNGTGDSSVARRRFPVPGIVPEAPANHEFAAQFPVALMLKDLRLALETAAEHGLDLPVVRQAFERYALAQRRGWNDLDYSVVARLDDAGSAD